MILLTKIEKQTDLEKIIQFLRKELILIGTKEGLTSDRTIKLSQKLDIHIAKYQALQIPKKNNFQYFTFSFNTTYRII